MDRDKNQPSDPGSPLPTPRSPSSPSPRAQPVVHAALIGAGTLACFVALGLAVGVFRATECNGHDQNQVVTPQTPTHDPLAKLVLFQGWDNPAPSVVLVLSGEQHGYLQPCGCSSPQYGGLARRYNLFMEMRKRGWPIVAADLGDVNQKKGPKDLPNHQGMLKYVYAMKSLDALGYTAVSFGEYETSLPLTDALANYALNNLTPRVLAANLMGRGPTQPFHGMNVFDTAFADKHAGPKIGIFALIGPSVEKKVRDLQLKFAGKAETPQIVVNCLRDLKKDKADLIVLLYQGNANEAAACADYCTQQHRQDPTLPLVDVIVCLSDDSQPPAAPVRDGRPMIVQVGHKGLNVGVMGDFGGKGTAPFQLKYQLVSIGPEFDTPAGQEKNHKVMDLMEQFTAELKRNDYLAKFKQVNHAVQVAFPNAEFVGSNACMNCHPHAFKVWQDSGHSHAYQTLVKTKNPSLRQFDGECIVCHTVGFGYKTGFESFDKTAFLTDVGCESCHGPASEHMHTPNKNNAKFPIYAAINPFKWRDPKPPTPVQENARMFEIDKFCQKCHDLDNDNHYQFNLKWPMIEHMTPKAAQPRPASRKKEMTTEGAHSV